MGFDRPARRGSTVRRGGEQVNENRAFGARSDAYLGHPRAVLSRTGGSLRTISRDGTNERTAGGPPRRRAGGLGGRLRRTVARRRRRRCRAGCPAGRRRAGVRAALLRRERRVHPGDLVQRRQARGRARPRERRGAGTARGSGPAHRGLARRRGSVRRGDAARGVPEAGAALGDADGAGGAVGGAGGERPRGDGALRGGLGHGDLGDAAADGLRQPDGAHGRVLRGVLRARGRAAAGRARRGLPHRPLQPRDADGEHRADADAVVLPRRGALDHADRGAHGEPALERRLRVLHGSRRERADGDALAGADRQAHSVAGGDGLGGEPDRPRGVPGPDRAREADAARDERPQGVDRGERGGRPVHGGAAAAAAVRGGLAGEQGGRDAAGRGARLLPGAGGRGVRERALPLAIAVDGRGRPRPGAAGAGRGGGVVAAAGAGGGRGRAFRDEAAGGAARARLHARAGGAVRDACAGGPGGGRDQGGDGLAQRGREHAQPPVLPELEPEQAEHLPQHAAGGGAGAGAPPRGRVRRHHRQLQRGRARALGARPGVAGGDEPGRDRRLDGGHGQLGAVARLRDVRADDPRAHGADLPDEACPGGGTSASATRSRTT